MSGVPVISLNALGMERNPGFRVTASLLARGIMALVYGDLLMRMLYRVRPYEIEAGAADRLCDSWSRRCAESLEHPGFHRFNRTIREMIHDFDALPIHDGRKPRVGVVGEILVKFHPTANNGIVRTIEAEGAEVVVPGPHRTSCSTPSTAAISRREKLAGAARNAIASRARDAFLELFRVRMKRELAASARFDPPFGIYGACPGSRRDPPARKHDG